MQRQSPNPLQPAGSDALPAVPDGRLIIVNFLVNQPAGNGCH